MRRKENSMGECNTILSAYTRYRHLGYCCIHPSKCQTHFVSDTTKERLFDRWCHLKTGDSDHDNLRQSMLVEELKRCINLDIKPI